MLNKDLVVASSKPLVLALLEKKESYWYEIPIIVIQRKNALTKLTMHIAKFISI